MLDWLWDTAASMLDASLGTSQMNKIYDLLTFNNDNYVTFWEVINELLDYVRPFGFGMITTWFLIHMFDAASKDQITIDHIIKVLIQLVLAVGLIGNIDLIVNAFLGITETLLGNMNGLDDLPVLSGADIVEVWKANDPYGAVGALGEIVWIWVLSKISFIAICFAALTRMLEIAWRIVFAPIGCSNVFEGGASSPGIKYLKSLFAVIISSVALYVVAETGYALAASFLNEGEKIVSELLTGAINGHVFSDFKNSALMSCATMLATAGAAIGVSNKIKEVIS